MSGSSKERRRRQRTRGSMVVAVLLLAGLLAGTELLLRAKPTVEVDDLAVAGVPTLSTPLVDGTCRRGVDDEPPTSLDDPLLAGGRTSSEQIRACPQAYDGRRVTYVGEAIGDLLPRDGGAWVHVNDDDYALTVGPLGGHEERRGYNQGVAVWLPAPTPELVEGVGRPGRRGDILLIEGVVHRADPNDGGGLTIRADQVSVLAPSIEIDEPFHAVQAVTALVLVAGAVASLLWARRVRQR